MWGKICIFPVRLSFTEATIRQVPQRMTSRSAHLCSCVLPFLTLNTPFSKVRSCWSAFTGCSGGKKEKDKTKQVQTQRETDNEQVHLTTNQPASRSIVVADPWVSPALREKTQAHILSEDQ